MKDGLVPVKFETFRKTLSKFGVRVLWSPVVYILPFLASFVTTNLPSTTSNYVFYIAMPSSTISISSQTLRQVFSAVKRAQKMHPGEQILFQFVPAQSVYSLKFSSGDRGGLFAFACSIYNRILSPVDRVMSRQVILNTLRTRDFFLEPAFSLARPLHTKVQFVRQFPALSLDVFDRHTLLHVGYQLSSCGKWLLACCVDQRGEAHDVTVWLLPSESPESFIAQHLWTFAVNIAKRASVEWRIVIAKLGSMDAREHEGSSSLHLIARQHRLMSLDTVAWIRQLDRLVPSCRELPMVYVSLMCVELDRAWTFIEPHESAKRPTPENRTSKSPISPSSNNLMIDSSSTTYHLSYSARVDLLSSSSSETCSDFESAQPYIADSSSNGSTASPYERLGRPNLRPLHTTTLVRVPGDAGFTSIAMLHLHQLHATRSHRSSLALAESDTLRDVCRNYHELSVLARSRWMRANPILPFHLAALEIMDRALRGSGSLASEV